MDQIKNLALVCVSSLLPWVAFLLVDLMIGLSRLDSSPLLCEHCEKNEIFEKGWYELKPSFDQQVFFFQNNTSYRVVTDENRYRVSGGKSRCSEDCADLLFLGDSSTFGVNGNWEDTFVGMIDLDSVGFNVINGGNESYSVTPYQYIYQRFLRTRKSGEAHLVVIAVDLSDVQDEAGHWKMGAQHPAKYQWSLEQKRKQAERNPDGHVEFPLEAYLPYTHSILGYFLFNYFISSPYRINRVAFTHTDWELLDQTHPTDGYLPLGVSEGIAKVEAGLKQLLSEIKQNNGKAIFLIYPWPNQMVFEDTHFDWSKFIHTICVEESCSGVIDLFPVMREYKQNHPTNWYTDLYVTGDTHFNTKGNQMIADRVLQFLDQNEPDSSDSSSSQ